MYGGAGPDYTAENANVFKLPCPLRVYMQAAPSVLLWCLYQPGPQTNVNVSVYCHQLTLVLQAGKAKGI